MVHPVRLRVLAVAVLALLSFAAPGEAQNKTWFVAEGATGFFEEDIAIVNPSATDANVQITFLTSTGAPNGPHAVLVPKTSRTTVRVNNFAGLSNAAVSARVTSDVDIIVERSMYWNAGRRGGHNAAGVNAPAATWHFAEGATGFFQLFFLVANPSTTTPANVALRYLPEGGGAPIVQNISVAPNLRRTVWVNSEVPGLTNAAFSTSITSDIPVLAERAMYWSSFEGGTDAVGVAALSNTWIFAEGFTGGGFETYLLLGNTSGTDSVVDVTYFLEGAAPVARQYVVLANQRRTVMTNQDAALQNRSFSMRVNSTVPIVAERAMYWGNFVDGHATTGIAAEAAAWGFAEGVEDANGGVSFDTYFLFANSTAAPITIEGTFYSDTTVGGAGAGLRRTFTLPAQSRLTLGPGNFPEMSNRSFGAFFRSVGASAGATFVVERAAYWGTGYYGGHANAGTPWTGAIDLPVGIPAPAVLNIAPNTGTTAGSTFVTIRGSNFTTPSTVFIGGVAATGVAVVDATTITAFTGPRAAGAADVHVAGVTGSHTAVGAYTYLTPAPPPPPPPPQGTANGPAIARFCNVGADGLCVGGTITFPFPQDHYGIIAQLAAERRDLLINSCVEFGGNNQFMFEAARRIRRATGSNRWGLNIKRGNQGLSQDIVTYYYGPEGVEMEGRPEVYIFDIVGGHCGPNPGPFWADQTAVTRSAGTLGRWTTWGQDLQ